MISVAKYALDRIDGHDYRRPCQMGIVQRLVTGLGNRVVGLIVSFLPLPLIIEYPVTERYGVWALVGSLLAWRRLAFVAATVIAYLIFIWMPASFGVPPQLTLQLRRPPHAV